MKGFRYHYVPQAEDTDLIFIDPSAQAADFHHDDSLLN